VTTDVLALTLSKGRKPFSGFSTSTERGSRSFSDLANKRILVMEDDFDQSRAVARAIEKHGGEVVGPYPHIAQLSKLLKMV
jgi:PleD family two-component response regulator